jgi:hypothetical protein
MNKGAIIQPVGKPVSVPVRNKNNKVLPLARTLLSDVISTPQIMWGKMRHPAGGMGKNPQQGEFQCQ